MKHSVRFRIGKVHMHDLYALGTKYFFLISCTLFRSYRFIYRKNCADSCLARYSLFVASYISNFRCGLHDVCISIMYSFKNTVLTDIL